MKKITISEGIGEKSCYVISEEERIEISNRCFDARITLRRTLEYLNKLESSEDDFDLEGIKVDCEFTKERIDELIDAIRS